MLKDLREMFDNIEEVEVMPVIVGGQAQGSVKGVGSAAPLKAASKAKSVASKKPSERES